MIKWALPALFLIFILYLARSVISPFIIAAALAYVFSPVVDELQERTRLPRVAVVDGLYVLILSTLGLGIWLVEGRLVREVRVLTGAGPNLLDIAFVRMLGSESTQVFGQRLDAHALALWTNE